MQDLKALNSRQKKEVYKQLEEQFGYKEKIDAIMLENSQDKIFLLSNDYANLDVEKLRVNNKAMYFGKKEHDGFRLSIEGAQFIKPTKNVIELTSEESHLWMLGKDIPKEGHVGFVILKYKKDILGCAMHKSDIIRNMVPKERRLHSVSEY